MRALQTHIEDTLTAYKTRYFADRALYTIPIVVAGEKVGHLRPVPVSLREEAARDAILQTEWRNLHKDSFLVPAFTATEERTLRWLDDTYFHSNRIIIFMVEAAGGMPIGHIGLSGFQFEECRMEVGRLLRGARAPIEAERRVNFLELGFNRMVAWSYEILKLRKLVGTAFADNWLSVRMNVRNGMLPVGHHIATKEGKDINMVDFVGTPETFKLL